MSSSPETSTRTTGAHRAHREARDRAAARTVAQCPPTRYEPYLDGLFTYCLSVLCDHDTATAALGDVLALAERRGHRGRETPDDRRAWLYALARWSCLRKLAEARQRPHGAHAMRPLRQPARLPRTALVPKPGPRVPPPPPVPPLPRDRGVPGGGPVRTSMTMPETVPETGPAGASAAVPQVAAPADRGGAGVHEHVGGRDGERAADLLDDAEKDRRRRELALLAWPEAAGTTPEQREALELAVRHQLAAHEVAAVLGTDPVAARGSSRRAPARSSARARPWPSSRPVPVRA